MEENAKTGCEVPVWTPEQELKAVVYGDFELRPDGLLYFQTTFHGFKDLLASAQMAVLRLQLSDHLLVSIRCPVQEKSAVCSWKSFAKCVAAAVRILRGKNVSVLFGPHIANVFMDALSFACSTGLVDLDTVLWLERQVNKVELMDLVHPNAILSEAHRRDTSVNFIAALVGGGCVNVGLAADNDRWSQVGEVCIRTDSTAELGNDSLAHTFNTIMRRHTLKNLRTNE
jgi:hypothetical protein